MVNSKYASGCENCAGRSNRRKGFLTETHEIIIERRVATPSYHKEDTYVVAKI